MRNTEFKIVKITLTKEEWELVEKLRGRIPRASFIADCIRDELKLDNQNLRGRLSERP